MKLRKHQEEMAAIIDEIINGAAIRQIIAAVTPGGGKSILPIIAGKLIAAGRADALCWVVPGKELQRQGEISFYDPFFRGMLHHNLSARASTNEHNPCRGLTGFITTYQALGTDKNRTVLTEFNRKRYILILDEYHHAEEGGVWHETLLKIESLAKYVVLMTGTLVRGNGTRIAFTPYNREERGLVPNLQATDTTRVIRYSRQDALKEKAIIPLTFFFNDGSASWMDATGNTIEYKSISKVNRKDVGSAIYTAISTEYADDLLNRGYAHWCNHKRNVYPKAKMIVVTAGIEHAKKAVEFFKKRYLNVEICTSHENKKALQAIKNFKSGKTDVLVGIAMFYEGFDCKQITHVIALTNIRSVPWLEQMLARAVRVDPDAGPYASQCGHVFAPDDVLFRKVVDRIKKEQLPFVKNRAVSEQRTLFDEGSGDYFGDEGQGNIYNITPLMSNLTGSRVLDMDGAINRQSGERLPDPIQIPSEIEAALRDDIENHVRQFSFSNRYKPQKINAAIKKYFGKTRSDMTINELQSVLGHIRTEYPLDSIRGYGRRVSTRAVVWQQ